MRNSLLGQSIEKLATARWSPAIESECKLVQVILKMTMIHGTLMGSHQPPLEQRNNSMNSRHQFTGRFLVSAEEADSMDVTFSSQRIIPRPGICVHHTARIYGFLNKWYEVLRGGIRYHTHPDPANASLMLLSSNDNQRLALYLASSTTLLGRAPVGFINFYSAEKPIPVRPDHCTSNFVKPCPCPCCLVTTQTKDALQSRRAGAGFLVGNPPHCPKPLSQRCPRVLEDGPGWYRRLETASGTLQKDLPNRPSLLASAMRASKAFRPMQTLMVIPAGFIRNESCFKFRQGSRVILHALAYYILRLPELRG